MLSALFHNDPALTGTDLELLQKLKLVECDTIETCEKVLKSLKMRELDMLKVVLARLVREGHFSPEIADGVKKNDIRAFARAIFQLSNKSSGKC